ncbi:MAG: NADH:ubiquinone reductase (Na(+)-transporting) subunit A [OM182 bacterium MED-G24]|uniref:Na(+)-translocating NADH-quinone reductase subunit A n=1 Tax=OM182 bacterium MED-G24 TaxID=1986255 RepID=A0A2A5WLX7_9GAMM|nr:MAG: NADH:ubiquinone reductase (Na(+)-transporting) subunit A [OM182 bacterium MED-G24]|tara:strand:- start:2707 stop:4050 length:1344 start_codon:yes stop_codon:yes gene_type:complete
MIKIKRGLDLPIAGSPEQRIVEIAPARSVALSGEDYPGLKPTMEVNVGDRVSKGQLVFTCKKNNGIRYTAPASGTVSAINRGAKRAFLSLVIDVEGDEALAFGKHEAASIAGLDRQVVADQLIESGEWTALRTRPFGKVPAVDDVPSAIFVNAMDTRPGAADPAQVIPAHEDAFSAGVAVLGRLTEGRVYICRAPGLKIPTTTGGEVQVEDFTGPHPAGLSGTHIHYLHPVGVARHVWHIDYQNLIAIGYLFLSGQIFSERVIALSGPGVAEPRLVRTRLGACTDELIAGQLNDGEHRVISGSVLNGREASGARAFLGRFHHQISVLSEGREREFLGFVMPGTGKYSVTRLFLSALTGTRNMPLTTSTGGSERAMVPIGTYEKVMPLDILPTQLLRSLLVDDIEGATELGCLELEEEDLSLCTFSCPGKYEYGPYLRSMLTRIEVEG